MNQDFLDLLRAFIDGAVRFLVVGASALAHHGRPRATGDLDGWVDPTAAISSWPTWTRPSRGAHHRVRGHSRP
jgi:hypothetical protein